MSSPRNCGSTAGRVARALHGALSCGHIRILEKLERSWTDPRLWETSGVCRISMGCSTDLA